ncbi:hypothetical protein DUGA6_58490 [Duganella sp. HH105]|nr:hypothetical protein DUGA6_58490 [Duganella sp. HH105]
MGHLDRLQHAGQFHLLVAPVELAGIASRELQRDKCFRQFGAMMAGLPALHKPLDAIVSTAVAQFLQALVETMGRTATRPRQLCLQFEPLRQLCLELPKLGRDRLYTCIAGFLNRLQMPAYRRSRDSHLPGDGGNRLLLDQMAPADFVNDVHVKHSRYLRRNTGWLHTGVETIGRCFHPESGKFCTLFDSHDVSKTPIWLRKAPNTSTREPSVCAGCACAVMDRSHEEFWSERFVRCKVSVLQAERTGLHLAPFREIHFRSDQARSILKKFGANLEALDARVTSIVESELAKT